MLGSHPGDRRILRQLGGAAGERRAQREERHERNRVLARQIDDRLVGAVDHAVGVLDPAELATLGVLDRELGPLKRHVGDADEVELALPAEVLERPELLGVGTSEPPWASRTRRLTRSMRSTRSERRLSSTPARSSGGESAGSHAALLVAPSADLGDELESVRIRIQRLADQVVDDVGPVILRGVDVIDAQLDRAAQDGPGASGSRGGPKTPGPASCIAPKPMRLIGFSPRKMSLS